MWPFLPTLEAFAVSVTQFAALVVDLIASVVIIYAVLRAFVQYAHIVIIGARERIEIIRFHLGKAIILSLEFLIGADILRTMVTPTWTLLAQLAVIIVLRTLLDFFLEWDISSVGKRKREEESIEKEEEEGEE